MAGGVGGRALMASYIIHGTRGHTQNPGVEFSASLENQKLTWNPTLYFHICAI